MRVGLFTDTFPPDVNGVVTVLGAIQTELVRRGHEVHCFAPAHPGDPEEVAGLHHFPSVPLFCYPGMRLAMPRRAHVLDLVRTLDVIHSHTLGPVGLFALWSAGRFHVPHVHTYHTHYTEYRHYLPRPFRPTRGTVIRLASAFCNRCDAIIAPSLPVKRELEGYGIRRPIHPLPFGLDEEEFSHEVEWNVRAEYGLPVEELLLCAGRLGPEKNLGFLLRVFKRLLARRESVRLFIVGAGRERSNLEQQAAALNIDAYVIFTGHLARRKLIDLYKQALFVFPSTTETQGMVLVEAMMAGSPVVAVGRMGVLDIVRPGETGILVEEDEEEFARACVRLLDDKVERERMGRAATIWARRHSAQASTERLLQIYIAAGACESVTTASPF